jgi:hypothetical protein
MQGRQPLNRSLTAEERTLLEWLLRHGDSGAEEFLNQLDSLWVDSKCDCGCPSLLFSHHGEPITKGRERMIADFLGSVDGMDVGIMLFEREGVLSMLDVYSLAGHEEPFDLPKIEDVYAWDEFAERQKNKQTKKSH